MKKIILTSVLLLMGIISTFASNDSCLIHTSFYTSNSTPCGNLIFHNTTTHLGHITSQIWSFGDGTISSTSSPTHHYSHNGTYYACLTVSGISTDSTHYCHDSICHPVTVSCYDTCYVHPHFYYMTSADSCGAFQFTNASYVTTGHITTINWNFGDGTTSTTYNPFHHFNHNGYYNVCLTVNGMATDSSSNCTNTYCQTVYIGCMDSCSVSANFSIIDSCSLFYFYNTSTSVGGFAYVNWNFGDGTTAINTNHPTHNYPINGSYMVCLTVYSYSPDSSVFCADSICQNINVQCDMPCGIDSINFDYKGDACKMMFNSNVGISGSGTYTVNWSFGDGTFGSGISATHAYIGPGTYIVCMYVAYHDPKGSNCYDTLCKLVNVSDCKFEDGCFARASFKYSINGCVLNVTNTSFAIGGFVSYYWSFGDGTYSTAMNPPPHAYLPYHSYTLCLYVSVYNIFTHQQCFDRICISINIGGCGNPCFPCDRAAHQASSNGTTINSSDLSSISAIFPNPSVGGFTISLSNKYLSEVNIPIEIYDVTGKIVYSEILPFYIPQKEIELKNINSGIYYLKIITKGNNENIKISIVK